MNNFFFQKLSLIFVNLIIFNMHVTIGVSFCYVKRIFIPTKQESIKGLIRHKNTNKVKFSKLRF